MNEANEIKCPIPGWRIVRVIGSGSFGKVYEIERTDGFGEVGHSAMKVISIPETSAEITAYQDDGYDEASITAMLRSQVEDITAEFSMMSKLKGNSNIVSYEDHSVIPHTDDPGYDIVIRMELLTSLPDYFKRYYKNNIPDNETVARVGADVCRALELCSKYNIIHRDIKPQNIFVNANGDFKLGDFGIAKTSDHTTKATKTGTFGYMAPEVFYGKPYNSAVDIYSLGLVMYWMLNERRSPFLPLTNEAPTPSQNAEALDRRMKGERLPAPQHGSPALAAVINKACAFLPEDRFRSATEMRMELEKALADMKAMAGGRVYSEVKVSKPAPPPIPTQPHPAEPQRQETSDMYEPTVSLWSNTVGVQNNDRSVGQTTRIQNSGQTPGAVQKNGAGAAPVHAVAPIPGQTRTTGAQPVNNTGSNGKKKKKTGLIIGIAAGAVVLAVCAGLLIPKLLKGLTKPVSVSATTPTPAVTAESRATPTPEVPATDPTDTKDWSEWTETLPPMITAEEYLVESKRQYRSAPLYRFEDREQIGSGYTIIREELGEWKDDEEWTRGNSGEFTETDTSRIKEKRTAYVYQDASYYTYYPEGDTTHTNTQTGIRWSNPITTYTPVYSSEMRNVIETYEEYLTQSRTQIFCCVKDSDWSEFQDESIAYADGRAVNVKTLYRYAPRTETEKQDASMSNFRDTSSKLTSQLADVPESAWYHDVVYRAYSLGALTPDEYMYFDPLDNLTVREVIEAAVKLKLTYEGERGAEYGLDCIRYAIEHGIIRDGDFENYDVAVTRADAVYILWQVLPQSELQEVNYISDILDMESGARAYRAVKQFAQAGIVSVSGDTFNFNPYNMINRAEASAIISRMAFPQTRAGNGK